MASMSLICGHAGECMWWVLSIKIKYNELRDIVIVEKCILWYCNECVSVSYGNIGYLHRRK